MAMEKLADDALHPLLCATIRQNSPLELRLKRSGKGHSRQARNTSNLVSRPLFLALEVALWKEGK